MHLLQEILCKEHYILAGHIIISYHGKVLHENVTKVVFAEIVNANQDNTRTLTAFQFIPLKFDNRMNDRLLL